MLVACDIFGMSEAFLSFLKETNIADHAVIASPYHGTKNHFETEQQAYQYFQQQGGIEAYVLGLSIILKKNTEIKHVVGFSAGAAALYKVVSQLPLINIKLTLFYPGQIRHFLDKHPHSYCHIIFPVKEPNFSLLEVIKVLKLKPSVKVEQTIYQHGFMNKESLGFNQAAYSHYSQMLKKLVLQT
mgnify:CR=1 FL=1